MAEEGLTAFATAEVTQRESNVAEVQGPLAPDPMAESMARAGQHRLCLIPTNPIAMTQNRRNLGASPAWSRNHWELPGPATWIGTARSDKTAPRFWIRHRGAFDWWKRNGVSSPRDVASSHRNSPAKREAAKHRSRKQRSLPPKAISPRMRCWQEMPTRLSGYSPFVGPRKTSLRGDTTPFHTPRRGACVQNPSTQCRNGRAPSQGFSGRERAKRTHLRKPRPNPRPKGLWKPENLPLDCVKARLNHALLYGSLPTACGRIPNLLEHGENFSVAPRVPGQSNFYPSELSLLSSIFISQPRCGLALP